MAVARALWGYIEQRDLRLMRRLHRWRAPRPIRILMLMMSRLGNGWLWYSLGIFILICGGQDRYRAFFAGALSALVAILIFQRVKPLQPSSAPLRNRTALLGRDYAAGPLFVSLRPRHDFFRYRRRCRQLLSSMSALPASHCCSHRHLAHYRRHAFPHRRHRRRVTRRYPRLSVRIGFHLDFGFSAGASGRFPVACGKRAYAGRCSL